MTKRVFFMAVPLSADMPRAPGALPDSGTWTRVHPGIFPGNRTALPKLLCRRLATPSAVGTATVTSESQRVLRTSSLGRARSSSLPGHLCLAPARTRTPSEVDMHRHGHPAATQTGRLAAAANGAFRAFETRVGADHPSVDAQNQLRVAPAVAAASGAASGLRLRLGTAGACSSARGSVRSMPTAGAAGR